MSSASSYSKSFWVSFLVGVWNRRQRPQAKKVELNRKINSNRSRWWWWCYCSNFFCSYFFCFFFLFGKTPEINRRVFFLKGGGVAGVLKRATWFLIFIFIKISKSDEREKEREARGQNSCHRHKVQREHVHIKKYKNQGSWASSYYISFSL
jgi:hypothetical protein